MVSAVASQQESPEFKSSQRPFWLESACFPRDYAVLPRSTTNLSGDSKLTIGVDLNTDGCPLTNWCPVQKLHPLLTFP